MMMSNDSEGMRCEDAVIEYEAALRREADAYRKTPEKLRKDTRCD